MNLKNGFLTFPSLFISNITRLANKLNSLFITNDGKFKIGIRVFQRFNEG